MTEKQKAAWAELTKKLDEAKAKEQEAKLQIKRKRRLDRAREAAKVAFGLSFKENWNYLLRNNTKNLSRRKMGRMAAKIAKEKATNAFNKVMSRKLTH